MSTTNEIGREVYAGFTGEIRAKAEKARAERLANRSIYVPHPKPKAKATAKAEADKTAGDDG